MKVLVNARYSSPAVSHGGPILARRHAEALRRHGLDILLIAPGAVEPQSSEGVAVAGYDAGQPDSTYIWTLRPNTRAERSIESIIDGFKPDLVYDVTGPTWAVAVAQRLRIPLVSAIGSYTWFCARDFLVDSNLARCTGPESAQKCFECETRTHPLKRRVVQGALKQVFQAGLASWTQATYLAPYRMWEQLAASRSYLAKLRSGIDCFVTCDRQARAFFLAQGVPPGRLTNIDQCLPPDALVVRHKLANPHASAHPSLTLAFVGRLDLEKGFHVLARAFESLPENAAVELWVIHVKDAIPGRVQALFRDQQRFLRQLEVGAIKLFRPATKDDLYTLMAHADVGVVPSIAYESPSLALMEFVAQSTPVIRSESGGMDQFIQDGVNGRTFPYGDHEALGRVIVEIMQDRNVLTHWRSRLPRIESDSVFAAKLVDVFDEVLARHKHTEGMALPA